MIALQMLIGETEFTKEQALTLTNPKFDDPSLVDNGAFLIYLA